MKINFSALMFMLIVISGCNGSGDKMTLDPYVLPIDVGNWYRPSLESTWQGQIAGDLNT